MTGSPFRGAWAGLVAVRAKSPRSGHHEQAPEGSSSAAKKEELILHPGKSPIKGEFFSCGKTGHTHRNVELIYLSGLLRVNR